MKIRITTKRGEEYVIENIACKSFAEFMDAVGRANGGFISFNDLSIHITSIESIKQI